MNRFPLWKYIVLIVVLGFGLIYAMPNLYEPDPAIQIRANSQNATVNEQLLNKATAALSEAGIDYFGEELTGNGNGLIRLNSLADQLPAQTVVKAVMAAEARKGARYVVALNKASTTPDWLASMGAKPMNLGLDLAGGVHFLLEVDTYKALNDRLEDLKQQLRSVVIDNKLYGADISIENQSFVVTTKSVEHQDVLIKAIRDDMPSLTYQRDSSGDEFIINARISDQAIAEIESHAVTQNLSTIRNRVNELGVSEPVVQKQGKNRIVVELPGVQDTAEAKAILGKTANLEFRMVAKPSASVTQRESFDWYKEEDQLRQGPVVLERRKIITGEHVVNAQAGFDTESNTPKIDITLDAEGGEKMHHATRDNIGRPMGTLFIEFVPEKIMVIEDGKRVEKEVLKEVKKVINVATVRDALGVRFQTTGLDSSREAGELALLLRSGSLAAPMKFVEERTIGPSLGAENIKQGVTSVQIGMLLVVLFMLGFYKVFGLAANIALTMNLILLSAVMSMLGATLTLPGIAGIVLTVGMAVDANVLIFSRIKEEIKAGLPTQSAIHSGFERAFTTIIDANITTLIVAFILFAVGTGPVKGFAVTLSIGILTSMFTAIWGTRAVINIIYGGRKVSKLWI